MEWLRLVLDFTRVLAWPIIVGGFIIRFRGDIRRLLDRLVEAKLPGGIEGRFTPVERALIDLGEKTEATVDAVDPLLITASDHAQGTDAAEVTEHPLSGSATSTSSATGTLDVRPGPATVDIRGEVSARAVDSAYDTMQKILDAVKVSPDLGLIAVSAELERQLNHVAAAKLGINRPLSVRTLVRNLASSGLFPQNLVSTLDAFWQVRNLIIHGGDATPSEVLQAIDYGLTILRTLQSVVTDLGINEMLAVRDEGHGPYIVLYPNHALGGQTYYGNVHKVEEAQSGDVWRASVTDVPKWTAQGTSQKEAERNLVDTIRAALRRQQAPE